MHMLQQNNRFAGRGRYISELCLAGRPLYWSVPMLPRTSDYECRALVSKDRIDDPRPGDRSATCE